MEVLQNVLMIIYACEGSTSFIIWEIVSFGLVINFSGLYYN